MSIKYTNHIFKFNIVYRYMYGRVIYLTINVTIQCDIYPLDKCLHIRLLHNNSIRTRTTIYY